MSDKILDSKIQMPIRLKNFVSRRELLDRLMDSSVKVVVLNAGAGFGKTMMLANYAMESSDKCAWYHLSSLDNDIMTFIKYLSYSLNKAIDSFNFYYDNHDNLSGGKLIDNIANEFLIYLSRFSDMHISIVLDDFQEIDNEDTYDFLTILIRNTSDNIRLLMSTRGAFPKFLARFMLHGSAMVINDKELAFNRDEILRILENIPTIDDIHLSVDLILDYTEGWPVGVMAIVLALKNERRTIDKEVIVRLCKESRVYDYIMYEIFKKLPYDIQTFLINTSVLNILSPDLCNAVMNITTAKSTLDYLVSENVFVIMLSGKGNVYRYHSIFKDYLCSQISKSTEQGILKKAAMFCLNKGDFEQAIEYAVSCNDMELMQAAFEEIGMSAINSGKAIMLGNWVDILLNSEAKLTCKTRKILSAYFYQNGDMAKALEYIDGLCEDCRNDGNENEYVDAILLKNRYLEEKSDISLCFDDILTALSIIKIRYSYNWYLLKFRKMELELLQSNESEAVKTAEDIIGGSMIYIRGVKKEQVNEIKSTASAVYEFGSHHINDEAVQVGNVSIASEPVKAYLYWCQIHYLYLNDEKEKALNLALPYLEEQQTLNIYTAYIKIVGCVILLHDKREDEAQVLIQDAGRYLGNLQQDYPRLLKQDLRLIKNAFSFAADSINYKKVYIRCFENGEIFVDGQILSIKWRTKKTFEMFAYLFDKYWKAVSKDNIIGVLWPDMPSDKSAILFHTTLSYLRKNLSENHLADLLCGKSGRYMLDIDKIDSDYEILMDIQRKLHSNKPDDRIPLEEITDLYKSTYFENISSDWIINKREHLERIYINCCKTIAKLLLEAERFLDCIVLLEKVIKMIHILRSLESCFLRMQLSISLLMVEPGHTFHVLPRLMPKQALDMLQAKKLRLLS